MLRSASRCLLLVVLCAWSILIPSGSQAASARKAAFPEEHLRDRTTPRVKTPLVFVENAGQTDAHVRFMARSMGGSVFFAPDEVVLALPTAATVKRHSDDKLLDGERTKRTSEKPANNPSVVRLQWIAAERAAVKGIERQTGTTHYLLGNDPKGWHTNVPGYAGIEYNGLYEGVTLRYDAPHDRLKATYTLAPHTNPATIRWRYTGTTSVTTDSDGNLIIALPEEGNAQGSRANRQTITEAAPIAWQVLDGKHVPVDVSYTISDDTTIGFRVGTYDDSKPLIIDPELVYSNFLGGSSSDTAFNGRLDQAGNLYIVGETYSPNFPTKNPIQGTLQSGYDIFVTKLDPNGQVLYSTYLGGNADDRGRGIAVDLEGYAAITGYTYSTNFPLRNAIQTTNVGGYQDAFVARLHPDGTSLVFSTYLGGSYWDQGTRVAHDGSGNIYVVGGTASANIPVTTGVLQPSLRGSSDAFVAKFPPDGSRLLYSTYLGGGSDEHAYGVAVHESGTAYVVGRAASTDFPTVRPLQAAKADSCYSCYDVFVSKLNSTGTTLDYSTYLGGNSDDQGYGVVLNEAGQAFVTGLTSSPNFPIAQAVQSTHGGSTDAFVTTIAADGSALVQSTFLGGNGSDTAFGIDVDAGGTAYISGETSSTNFPLQTPLYSTNRGSYDAFVTLLPSGGTSWLESTYLGGYYADRARSITVNRATGRMFVVGETASADFNACANGQTCSPYAGGALDGFVTSLATVQAPSTPTNVRVTGTTVTSVALAWESATDNVAVTGYNVYQGNTLVGSSQSPSYTVTGLTSNTSYTFTVKARDAAGQFSPASLPATATTAPDTEAPAAPTSLRATAKTGTSINLAWNPATDNVAVTGYKVYQDNVLLATTTDRSYIVTGLESSTNYSFIVKAIDEAGNISVASNVLTTSPSDVQAPSAPSNLRGTGVTATTIGLAWDAATDDVGVAQYNVYKNGALVGHTALRSYTVTGLTLNTSYTFTVKASDATGNLSAASDAVTIATADTTPPSAPQQLRSTGRTTNSVDLAWDAATDDVGVEGYRVYSGSQFVGYTQSLLFTVTGLTNNTSYTFTVRAQDKAGNISIVSNGSAITVQTTDTEPPTAPTNVRSTGATVTTISLAWDAASDNIGVTEYGVYNGLMFVGSTTNTNFVVSRLTPNTNYSFTVRAADNMGNISAPSNEVAARTLPDTTAPTAPSNLRSTGKTGTSVNLAWDAASDDVAVTGYNVYRDGTQVGTTQAQTFLVTGLTQNTAYTFTVKAIDGAGNMSAASNGVTVTTVDTAPPTAPTNVRSTAKTVTTISLTWNVATDNVGVTSYKVYRDGTLVGTATDPAYTVTSLEPNKSYVFTVRAVDAVGNMSTASTPATITTEPDIDAPTTPLNLRSTGTTGTSVSLAWGGATDNVTVTGYNVYRDGTLAGTATGTSYTIGSLTRNTGYTFTVKAIDGAGNLSASSNTLTVTTGDGPGATLLVPQNYSSIQAALNAAVAGDTVLVAPGTYNERLQFKGKSVTLQSTDGPTTTTIDGTGGTVVDIGPGGQLSGFTITNRSTGYGEGVAAHGTGTVIKGNIFEYNNSSSAAIDGFVASPTVEENIFRHNTCGTSYSTGVIAFFNGSSPTIANNVFEDNNCPAVTMVLPEGNKPLVINNVMIRNRVGIQIDARVPSILEVYRNNLIVNNTTGLQVNYGSPSNYPTWEHNLVWGNTTNYSGIPEQTGGRGNISVDPLLIDPANRNYAIRSGSPAIDTGHAASCPATDFRGVARPQGNQCDIGAFEYDKLPMISTITPTTITVNSGALNLVIKGTNFTTGSVTYWNGMARTTTLISTTEIRAAISADDIASIGTAQISVRNSEETRGTSNIKTVSIVKADQAISFEALPNKTFGDAAFTLTATASSGLPVRFTASGSCSVNDTSVNINTAGTCTITAQQAGSAAYNAASDVPRTFTIAKANQTITFEVLPAMGVGSFEVLASASSGLPVQFKATGACTITGTTVAAIGTGACVITAQQPGDSNYMAARDVTQTIMMSTRVYIPFALR